MVDPDDALTLFGYDAAAPVADGEPTGRRKAAAGTGQKRAPKREPMTAEARREYRRRHWPVTASGNVGLGSTLGPCIGRAGRCGALTVRYGPTANPLCLDCRS